MRKKISISLDENILDAITEEARKERRSVSNYIETAIERFFFIKENGKIYENQIELFKEA